MLLWIEDETLGELGPGGVGLDAALHQAIQMCVNIFAGADPRSSIGWLGCNIG